MENKIIKKIKENIVYQNKYATIYDDDVLFPNGKNSKYIKFMWNCPYGVVILPIVEDGGIEKMLIIKEYSYREEKWGWNIPKGMGEKGVEPKEQAINELEEETGLKCLDIEGLFNLTETVKTANGVFFYEARVNQNIKSEKKLDDGEAIDGYLLLSKKQARKMLYDNHIDCYHTAVAILHWLSK